MSRPEEGGSTGLVEPLICEFCGCYIREAGQECAALADGECDPDPYGNGGDLA